MGSPLRVTLQPTPPQCDQPGVFTTLHILTLAMMTNIKFSHWFWITSLTIFFHCPSVLSTDDEEITSLKDSAIKRDAKSIDSSSHVNVLGDQVEFSTSRSVSVCHVRVEVQKVGPRLRKIRKISKQNKRKKMKKSFLENIFSKLKEFARVTLASRRAAARNKTPRRGPASHNTGNSSHRPIILTEMTAGSPADGESSSEAPADHTGDGAESSSHSEPLNVMSFNEFSDGPELVPELVDTNDVSENNKAADIETSNTRYGMVPHTMGNQRQRSEEARGRSLWKVSRPAGDVTEDHERPGASFASFTQEAAVLFDSKVGRDGGRGEGLMAWTNVIILGVSMVTVFALVSVLVVAVLYRRAKSRAASHCDQFSDILSTSSRSSASTASTASTLSSGRSGRTVPDRTDGISFHSEGQLRKSVYTCEDLYSLDSDYFLSSLEDISVQI